MDSTGLQHSPHSLCVVGLLKTELLGIKHRQKEIFLQNKICVEE